MAKKLSERSDRSREKWADSLMTAGTMIHATAVINIFVSVLIALVTVFLSRGELPALTEDKLNNLLPWLLGWAVLCFPVPLFLGGWLKKKAMDIYDELFEKEQTKDCKARLTNKVRL